MVFEQIKIEGELGRVVSELVYYTGNQPVHPIDRFFPDANAYLILELKDVPQHTYDEQQHVTGTYRKYWFSGNRTQSMRFDSGEGVEMFVITIKNAFAYPIFHRPMAGYTNAVVQGEELFEDDINQLWEELKQTKEFSQRVDLIKHFFKNQIQWDEKTLQWLELIEGLDKRYVENIAIEQLVEEVGLSQKSLIQQFRKLIGITPKEFVQLKRFQKFIGLLSDGADISSLTSLAFECGYFDQSHCIREFRKFTGTTPTDYLKNRSGYDNYMVD